jgi:hypothetical protein
LKWIRQCVLVVLLALWVPATVHCDLEIIPSLSFLNCTDTQGGPHSDAGCGEDSCAEVESASYRLEDNPSPILLPVATALLTVLLAAEAEVPTGLDRVLDPATFDGSPQGWRFSCRAALPPRAPCFIS